ncbi:MAG TPA: ProQ/FinO family protein [Ideonella sp.]|nr:ProQ/FinO family protein [Ideonella sp.]
MSPAACAERLKALFPALFSGPAKPIKLRIQADIQARAPGEFTKAALSGFLRRYTGSTSYLIALTRAPQRVDLDGQPAGEISAEHRQAAADELARRRAIHEGRRQAEEDQRRERFQLLRAFQSTTLTKENFCALKGMTPEALDALLAQAQQEAEERARQMAAGHGPGRTHDDRPDRTRHARPNERPPGDNPGRPRHAEGQRHAEGPRHPEGPRRPEGPRQGRPPGPRGPRPPRQG